MIGRFLRSTRAQDIDAGARSSEVRSFHERGARRNFRELMVDRVPEGKCIAMTEDFYKQRAREVRDLAAKADPFIKQRLLDLADRYDGRKTSVTPLPPAPAVPNPSDDHDGNSG
jgi:hypothetical protein